MSNTIKFFKETALPHDLQPNAVYIVAPGNTQDYVEVYVTNNVGNKARRVIDEARVRELISVAVSGSLRVVDDISKRDEIQSPVGEVYVIDASADPTVTSGGARYLYHSGSWLKIAESESMDLVFNWEKIEGKPQSSAQEIDNAVGKSHEHLNKTQLDKIGEDGSGNLTYGGEAISASWAKTLW